MDTEARVAVVTDSTSYIPEDLVKCYQITVVPQILNWEGESYLDGIDISNQAFYAKLENAKELPTSAQPSPGQFLEAFEGVQESATSIICIVISDELSGTFDSARAAASSMTGLTIDVIDSRSTSMGLGLLVLLAARMAEEGCKHKQVADYIRALIPRMHLLFVVDTLEYLHKGGRIGGAQRLLGSVLSIKPILHIERGRIEPLESVRTKKKALRRLVELVQEETQAWHEIHVAVVDATAPDTADYIFGQLAQTVKPVEIIRGGLSPVVGTHAGPGAIGVAFIDASLAGEQKGLHVRD
jgi:DegV family protein with EDD domain